MKHNKRERQREREVKEHTSSLKDEVGAAQPI
jgi:hypothetical protein